MEFKLNKIDVELRKTPVPEKTEKKVHRKDKIVISENPLRHKNQRDKKKQQKEQGFDLEQYKGQKSITVGAEKSEEIKVEAELKKSYDKSKYKGIFLDKRK